VTRVPADDAPDPREAAARYLQSRDAPRGGADETGTAATSPANRRVPTSADRAAFVETVIQQAIRNGEFDDLPGAGKPLPDLGGHHDPDWWIRRKIQTEDLRGLGPPALTLRVENAELDERLDALHREADVREALEDFNRRVRLARMQLLGGPPVVTPVRDVDAEVAAWHDRRRARLEAARPEPDAKTRRRRRRRERSRGEG
jgi:hypothetical protein